MDRNPRTNRQLAMAGQNLTRILIASYFLAVSLGLINGTDSSVLIVWLLPGTISVFGGNAVVFVLGYLVLTGIWLRPAALLLAIILFWSSYLTSFGTGNDGSLDEFWRDLALIGGLILTYTQTSHRSSKKRAMFRKMRKVRRISPSEPGQIRRPLETPDPALTNSNPDLADSTPDPAIPEFDAKVIRVEFGAHFAAKDEAEIENIFAEDRTQSSKT